MNFYDNIKNEVLKVSFDDELMIENKMNKIKVLENKVNNTNNNMFHIVSNQNEFLKASETFDVIKNNMLSFNKQKVLFNLTEERNKQIIDL